MTKLEIALQIGKYIIAIIFIGLVIYGYTQIIALLKEIAGV